MHAIFTFTAIAYIAQDYQCSNGLPSMNFLLLDKTLAIIYKVSLDPATFLAPLELWRITNSCVLCSPKFQAYSSS